MCLLQQHNWCVAANGHTPKQMQRIHNYKQFEGQRKSFHSVSFVTTAYAPSCTDTPPPRQGEGGLCSRNLQRLAWWLCRESLKAERAVALRPALIHQGSCELRFREGRTAGEDFFDFSWRALVGVGHTGAFALMILHSVPFLFRQKSCTTNTPNPRWVAR